VRDVESRDRGTALAEQRTELAIKRSAIAADRTLMAWVRTAISMIGFGFSIYKFFQYLPSDIAKGNVAHPYAPRNFGLTLIAIGTLALAGATWQHRNFLKEIGGPKGRHMLSIPVVVAMVVVLVGILAFYGVLLHYGPY
jgi:putative membrane protein